MVHTEAELIHIRLHMPYRHLVIDAIHTSLDDCPERLNAVGMSAVTLRELDIVVHHNADELLGILWASVVKDVVATVLVRHYRSTLLAGVVQHL